MNGWEYLAAALELWTAVGIVGLIISLVRRERRKLREGVASLLGVWIVYLAVLLTVSQRQPERHVPLGRGVCYSGLCYRVARVEELSGFPARNHTRLLRLTVQMTNGSKTARIEEVAASLRDARGLVWRESPGVSGNRLDVRVAGGSEVVAQPVFQLAPEASDLGLILTHGRSSRHALVIGDPESLHHRPQVMDLGE